MANRRFYLVLLLAVGVLGGCHSRPGFSELEGTPLRNHQGHAGSLVLPNQPGQAARADSDGRLPWYAWRNDIGPSVTAGYQSTRYETSVTYTRDRQFISGGRAYDRYDQTTYRRSYRESSR